VSVSNAQSGGQFTMNGGYWNTLQTPSASPTATPTPTPTATPTPTPTPTPASTPTPSPTPTPPNVIQFSSATYSVQEDCTFVTITVNRIGDTSGAASVNYS